MWHSDDISRDYHGRICAIRQRTTPNCVHRQPNSLCMEGLILKFVRCETTSQKLLNKHTAVGPERNPNHCKELMTNY